MATLRDKFLQNTAVDLSEFDPRHDHGQLRRGFRSGRIGTDVNSALADEASLRASGDMAQAAARRAEANTLRQQQAFAPTRVSRVENIGGFGDAADYALGTIGQAAASMMEPVAASAAAAAVGRGLQMARNPLIKGAGRLLAGPGALAAPLVINQEQAKGEFYGQASADEEIMRTRSAQDLNRDANLVGLGSGLMDSVMPALVGRSVVGLGSRVGAGGMGGRFLRNAGIEGATELGQGELQRQALLGLNAERDQSGFGLDRINDFAAGVVGGAPFSAVGAAADSGSQLVGDTTRRAGDLAGQTFDLMGEGAERAMGAARGAMGQAGDALSGAAGTAGDALSEGTRRGGTIDLAAQSVRDRFKQASERVTSGWEERQQERDLVSGRLPDDLSQGLDPNSTDVEATAWIDKRDAWMDRRDEFVMGKLNELADNGDPDAIRMFEEGATADDAMPFVSDRMRLSATARAAQRMGEMAITAVRGAGPTAKKVAGQAREAADAAFAGFKQGQSRKQNIQIKQVEPDTTNREGGAILKGGRGSQFDVDEANTSKVITEALEVERAKANSYRRAQLYGEYLSALAEADTPRFRAVRAEKTVPEFMKSMGAEISDLSDSWLMAKPTPEQTKAPVEKTRRPEGPMSTLRQGSDSRGQQFENLKLHLNRVANHIVGAYGERAPQIVSDMWSMSEPEAGPFFDFLEAQVAQAATPQGDRATINTRKMAGDRLVAMLTPEIEASLLKEGLILRSEEGKRTLLGMVEAIGLGRVNREERAQLEDMLGEDTLKAMVQALNPLVADTDNESQTLQDGIDEQLSANGLDVTEDGDVIDAEQTGDFEKRAAEKNLTKGSGPTYYGFAKMPTMRNSDASRDPFEYVEKISAAALLERLRIGEDPPRRPGMFRMNDTTFEDEPATWNRMNSMQRQLKSDNFRVRMQVASNLMDTIEMHPLKKMRLFQDYMAQEGRPEKKDFGAVVAEKAAMIADGKLARLYVLEQVEADKKKAKLRRLLDMSNALTKGKTKFKPVELEEIAEFRKTGATSETIDAIKPAGRLSPAEKKEVRKKAREYFDSRWVAVAEPMTDADPDQLTPASVQSLAVRGRTAFDEARKPGADADAVMDADNLLTFNAANGKPVYIKANDLAKWARDQRQGRTASSLENADTSTEADGDREFVRDMLTGVSAIMATDLVKGLPKRGKTQSFADGIPAGLILPSGRRYSELRRPKKNAKDRRVPQFGPPTRLSEASMLESSVEETVVDQETGEKVFVPDPVSRDQANRSEPFVADSVAEGFEEDAAAKNVRSAMDAAARRASEVAERDRMRGSKPLVRRLKPSDADETTARPGLSKIKAREAEKVQAARSAKTAAAASERTMAGGGPRKSRSDAEFEAQRITSKTQGFDVAARVRGEQAKAPVSAKDLSTPKAFMVELQTFAKAVRNVAVGNPDVNASALSDSRGVAGKYGVDSKRQKAPVLEARRKEMELFTEALADHRQALTEKQKATVSTLMNQLGEDLDLGKTTASPKEGRAPTGKPVGAAVNVWHGSGESAALSNLAPRAFELGGKKFLSVEHAYQSWKSGEFDETTYGKYTSAGRKIAGTKGTKTDGNWNVRMMAKLVKASFDQNPAAAQALLATGDSPITHSQDGGVWKKEFPRILMEVRAGLKPVGARSALTVQQTVPTTGPARKLNAQTTQAAQGIADSRELMRTLGFKSAPERFADVAAKLLSDPNVSFDKFISDSSEALSHLLMDGKSGEAIRTALSADAWFPERAKITARLVSSGVKRGDALVQSYREITRMALASELQARSAAEKSFIAQVRKAVQDFVSRFKEVTGSAEFADLVRNNLNALAAKAAGPIDLKANYTKVSFQQAVDGDPQAARVLAHMSRNPNVSITGSIVLADSGTIYRDAANMLHDLDFVVKGTKEAAEAYMREAFPNAVQVYDFNTSNGKVDSYLVPPAGAKIENIVREFGEKGRVMSFEVTRGGKVIGRTWNDASGEKKEGNAGTFVDFFTGTTQAPVKRIPFVVGGENLSMQAMGPGSIFDAKLSMGRAKDLNDYLRYTPVVGRKLNAQGAPNAQPANSQPSTPAEQAEAKAYVKRVLGPQVKTEFKDITGYAGEWVDADQAVYISTTSAPGAMQTAYHEALHGFFSKFVQGDERAMNIMKALADHRPTLERVMALLDGYPQAQAQLVDGEERLAYIYQFWAAGLLDLPTGAPKTLMQKVKRFFARVAGMVRNEQKAMAILEAFHRGDLSGEPSAAGRVFAKAMNEGTWTKKNLRKIDGLFQKVAALTVPAESILSNSASVTARKLGKMFYASPAIVDEDGVTTNPDAMPGYLNARAQMSRRYTNEFARIVNGFTDRDFKEVSKFMNAGTDPATIAFAPHATAVKQIRALLGRFRTYMVDERGMDIGDQGPTYFPRVWNSDRLIEKRGEFLAMMAAKYPEHNALAVYNALSENLAAEVEAGRPINESGVLTPLNRAGEERIFSWMSGADAQPFLEDSLIGVLTRYFHEGSRAAEYTQRFGQDGSKLESMLAKIDVEIKTEATQMVARGELADDSAGKKWAMRQMRDLNQSVGAMEGTLGKDISPAWRNTSSWTTTYQNIRLLPLSLFSSVVDPLGLVVRGAEFNEAFEAFTRGMKEVGRSWKDLFSSEPTARQADKWERLAEYVGSIDAAIFDTQVADMYASTYMNPTAKRLNDKFFKLNGMEGWNRGMRIGATKAAVKFMERHSKLPEEHSKRWLTELGLTPADLNLTADGDLMVSVPEIEAARNMTREQAREHAGKIHSAIERWVTGAVVTPNAAQRPAWASDPHYTMFFHLKQFTYSFHNTILKRVYNEMNHGNLAPLATLFWYSPVMIASDITKGLIQGGGDLPTHMQGMDVGDWVLYSLERSGVVGLGTLGLNASGDLASIGGPQVEQIVDAFSNPLERTVVTALPAMPVFREALL